MSCIIYIVYEETINIVQKFTNEKNLIKLEEKALRISITYQGKNKKQKTNKNSIFPDYNSFCDFCNKQNKILYKTTILMTSNIKMLETNKYTH